jgi:hypothetical protein
MRQRTKFGGSGDLVAGICTILEYGMAIKGMKGAKFHLLQERKNIKERERTRVLVRNLSRHIRM